MLPILGRELSNSQRIVAFRANDVFEIEFIQVVATDPDLVNDINTEEEVQQFLQPYFEQRIFGRPIAILYRKEFINYADTFGPHRPCTEYPDLPESWQNDYDICFDQNLMRLWAAMGTLVSNTVIVHWGAKELTDGRSLLSYYSCQTCFRNSQKVTRSLTTYAHEFGHYITLPHPLTSHLGVDARPWINNLLGTCGVMARPGYVPGCVDLLDPLARYKLEPYAGYADYATFGPTYSAEVLAPCN